MAWVAWIHKIGVGPNFGIGQKNGLCQNKIECVKINIFRSLWFPCHTILSYSPEISYVDYQGWWKRGVQEGATAPSPKEVT